MKRAETMAEVSTDNKVQLNLLVDKEKRRVVLAESDTDFVDMFFGFLTLPMGAIVRILGKPRELGCLSNLYASVENLGIQHFCTEACKTMLLWPRSGASFRCGDLKIKIDDTNIRDFYKCFHCQRYYSDFQTTTCPECVKPCQLVTWNEQQKVGFTGNGVFVKEGTSFMITDDLRITEASTRHSYMLLNELGVQDLSILEEMTMYLGRDEILNLLKKSLISKIPLSEICFSSSGMTEDAKNIDQKETFEIAEAENVSDEESEKIRTTLLLDEVNNRVVYLEAGDELINLLFSFLTFPLGSVIEILGKNSSMGCIDNLYTSAQELSTQYFNSEESKTLLLSPKLAPFFGCGDQLLKVPEVLAYGGMICAKLLCHWKKDLANPTIKCDHGFGWSLIQLNPKSPNGTVKSSRFVKENRMFLIMDTLGVTPLTPISTIKAASELKVPTKKIVEKELNIGELQAIKLLRTALTSQSVLNDAFYPAESKSRRGRTTTSAV